VSSRELAGSCFPNNLPAFYLEMLYIFALTHKKHDTSEELEEVYLLSNGKYLGSRRP